MRGADAPPVREVSEVGGMKDPDAGIRPAPRSDALPAALALVLALSYGSPAGAQTAAPATGGGQPAVAGEVSLPALEARIEELERRLGASALLDLVARVDRLAKEIQVLRGRAEVDARALEGLRSRQQDLYAELDRLAQRIAQPTPELVRARPGAAEGSAPPAEPGAGPAAEDAGSPGQREPGGSTAAAPERELPDAAETGGGASGGAPEPAGEPAYDPVEEQERYQLAFDLLSEGRFERAATAFAEFLTAFPESRYHDTARFWKGECLYALRRFEPALREFRMLVENHPDSPSIPGAKLKIGFILHELGRPGEAAEELRALIESAPDTSEAKLARDRIERLQ